MKKMFPFIIFFHILLVYAVDDQPAEREPLQRAQPTGVRKRQRDSGQLRIGAIKKARSSKKGNIDFKMLQNENKTDRLNKLKNNLDVQIEILKTFEEYAKKSEEVFLPSESKEPKPEYAKFFQLFPPIHVNNSPLWLNQEQREILANSLIFTMEEIEGFVDFVEMLPARLGVVLGESDAFYFEPAELKLMKFWPEKMKHYTAINNHAFGIFQSEEAKRIIKMCQQIVSKCTSTDSDYDERAALKFWGNSLFSDFDEEGNQRTDEAKTKKELKNINIARITLDILLIKAWIILQIFVNAKQMSVGNFANLNLLKYGAALLHKSAKKLLNVATAAKNLSNQYQFVEQLERVNTENGTFAKAEADYNRAIAQLVPHLEAAQELDLPGLEAGRIVPYESFTGKRYYPGALDAVLEKALLQDCANMELIIYEGKDPREEMVEAESDSEDDF